MSQPRGTPRNVRGAAPSPAAFWTLFAGAWLAYAALVGTVLMGEGHPPAGVARGVGIMLLAHGAPAVVLAWRRRDLLQPDRSLARTVGTHLVAGGGYALTATVLIGLLTGTSDPLAAGASMPAMTLWLARFATALFLYLIVAGLLMWSESLVRVQESRALAAREAELRAQAEAEVLRARFNPHFVFNTLHSLMLLVRAEPAAAEQAIEDVAALIRYASVLQRTGVDVVTIDEEMEVARRYLALEALRMEDRLRVEWRVDERTAGLTLPPFSLQTLLENAIKHGLAPRARGGTVRVSVGLADGHGTAPDGADLLVTVEDDGAGASPADVARVPDRGLQLVQGRLQTLYDGRASLSWDTAPGEGFRVTLRVPSA